jgi:hypothetical protein
MSFPVENSAIKKEASSQPLDEQLMRFYERSAQLLSKESSFRESKDPKKLLQQATEKYPDEWLLHEEIKAAIDS